MKPQQHSFMKFISLFSRVPNEHLRMSYVWAISVVFLLFINFSFFSMGILNHAVTQTDQSSILNLSFPSTEHIDISINPSDIAFPGFTENQGQITDPELFYYFMQETYAIGFYESKIQVFARLNQEESWESLSLTFPGSSACIPQGSSRLLTVSNFYNVDPVVESVSHWAEIWYDSLYPGISMRFYADRDSLKYEFLVSPNGDPSLIQLELDHTTKMDMVITPNNVKCTSLNTPDLRIWEDKSPISSQVGNPEIKTEFQLIEGMNNRYSFSIGGYDHSIDLVIDPLILKWSTYLGGNLTDFGVDIAVDAEKCVYIIGNTFSPNFPRNNASLYNTTKGMQDICVAKFAANGSSLLYSTYLGGSKDDFGRKIFLDENNSIYIIGDTLSPDFPMSNNTFMGSYSGASDSFVVKLAANGSSLLYSTYLGGSNIDYAWGGSAGANGSVYIVGETRSTDFPTVNAYSDTLSGTRDGFVTILATNGSSLLYSTYIGGSGMDIIKSVSVDEDGFIYILGETRSTDFPLVDPIYTTHSGSTDCFVSKIATDGQSLIYSTYLGGSDIESPAEIDIDKDGCVYITGATNSFDFPTVNAYDDSLNGSQDGFVTKFAADGHSLIYSTFLGGIADDGGNAIAVDGRGSAYITGYTLSTDFPVLYSLYSKKGDKDAFITKLPTDGQSIIYSTFFGGTKDDIGFGIAVDEIECTYVVGMTNSSINFPLLNSYDNGFNKREDIFVSKFDLDRDGDTLTDYMEYLMGLNATDPTDALADMDNDTISNIWEFLHGLNHTDPSDAALDPDADGLINAQEFEYDLNPFSNDTDNDKMPDGWEITHGFNPKLYADGGQDLDWDDLKNYEEFRIGTDPRNWDSDGDLLWDRWEYTYGLDPLDPTDAGLDFDGDGLTNYEEFILKTSPINKDTDHDGFNDRVDPRPFDRLFPWIYIIWGIIGVGFIAEVMIWIIRKLRLRSGSL